LRGLIQRTLRFIADNGGAHALDLLRHYRKSRELLHLQHLNRYEKSIYSQNGEDGIIKELIFRIGVQHRYFVEFGVGTGEECNTALLARQYSWQGLMLESDTVKYDCLSQLYKHTKVTTLNRTVSADNIESIFQAALVPVELDLLSIDIDGNDYWVWAALTNHRPRIVVIEYNAAIPPPEEWVMPYDNPTAIERMAFGASLQSLKLLGDRLGYALIGTESRGVNAFFVRRDVLKRVNFPELTAAEAYHRPRFAFFGLASDKRPPPQQQSQG